MSVVRAPATALLALVIVAASAPARATPLPGGDVASETAAPPASSGSPVPGGDVASESAAPPASPGNEVASRPSPASPPPAGVAADALLRLIDEPHTVAELEAGIIALPNAPISKGERGGDAPIVGKIGRGDATLQTGIHLLYRWHRRLAFGAGALFAPRPTSDERYGGLGELRRTHARSYLFFGLEGRYVPVHHKHFEAWVGLSSGAVIVADRYTTEARDAVPPILGTPDVTIRTEGFALGVQGGGSYYLTESWIAGASVRGYHWILPQEQRCSPAGDCATLTGSVQAVELGLTIGYRLPL